MFMLLCHVSVDRQKAMSSSFQTCLKIRLRMRRQLHKITKKFLQRTNNCQRSSGKCKTCLCGSDKWHCDSLVLCSLPLMLHNRRYSVSFLGSLDEKLRADFALHVVWVIFPRIYSKFRHNVVHTGSIRVFNTWTVLMEKCGRNMLSQMAWGSQMFLVHC